MPPDPAYTTEGISAAALISIKKSTTTSILLFSLIFAQMQATMAHGSRWTLCRPTTILHPTPSPSPTRIMALPIRPAPPSKQISRNTTLEPCTELNPISSAEQCVGGAHDALGTAGIGKLMTKLLRGVGPSRIVRLLKWGKRGMQIANASLHNALL